MKYELVNVNGYQFQIGHGDVYGPVFTVGINGKFYGCRTVRKAGDEIGWGNGLVATEDQAAAINAAREIMRDKTGRKF